MSVMMIDLEVYEQVAQKLWSFTFNKVCDINYNYPASKLTETEIDIFVRSLCRLNEQSYCIKYKQKFDELSSMLEIKFNRTKPDVYQFLKSMRAIRYNIEISTIEHAIGQPISEADRKVMKLLDEIIECSAYAIIGELPEYQNAKWNEVYRFQVRAKV